MAQWLAATRDVIRGEAEADVPCDGCTACCRSGQFIHVGPDELDALANIPDELLFPAPGAPPGHRLMGYDENGHCPMLVDDRCSIYEHRPATCRAFDCRVFAATGVAPEGAQSAMGAVVAQWHFDVDGERATRQAAALLTAGAFVERNRDTERFARSGTTQLGIAVTAVQLALAELDADPT